VRGSEKCPSNFHDNLGGGWCGVCPHGCMGLMRQLEGRWMERDKVEGVMTGMMGSSLLAMSRHD